MNHPLDGCIERLKRAEAHLKAFESALKGLDPNTAVPAVKPDLDLERMLLLARVSEDGVLPLRFGAMFGDVIHNVHATLDNLVYELGNFGPQAPGRESKFPILREANEWFSPDVRDSLKAVGPQDRARIESHQPFMLRNGVAANDNVLARIQDYSNEGKHRVVTPLWGNTMDTIIDNIEPKDLTLGPPDIKPPKPFRQDAVLVAWPVLHVGTNPKVSMKGSVTWHPSLDNGDPPEQFLRGAYAYVRELVVEFADASFGGMPT